MARSTRKLLANPPPRLRQRQRADGSWRLWWEPETAVRTLGFEAVELDAERVTWSQRQAENLNDKVAAARAYIAKPKAENRRGTTVSQLIRAYQTSPKFETKKPKTQQDYRTAFAFIENKWGSSVISDFTKPIIYDWYETLWHNNGRYMALATIRKFSVLFSYAERKGWCDTNPCLRLQMHVPMERSRVVSWDELDALLAAAIDLGRPSVAACIALSFFMGQRQTDVVNAQRADFDGKYWRLLRSKRGNLGVLELNPDALPYLRPMLAAYQDQPALIISETTGKPYLADNFRDVWARVRSRAARSLPSVSNIQFRDLRRSFGANARAAGASERDVADALGNKAHTDPGLSATYMPASAETAARAVDAARRPKPTIKKGTGK